MDWNAAIEKNREALKRVLAALVAMAGLGSGQAAIGSRQSGSAQADDGPTDCPLPTADCRLLLPRHLHRAVLRLLRPAEAAARRLVIVAARGLALPPMRPRRPRGEQPPLRNAAGNPAPGEVPGRSPGLPLFDPLPRRRRRRRHPSAAVPRISVPGFGAPFSVPAPPTDADPIDATRLAQRLAALASALDDLPRAARRFARWRARLDAGSAPAPYPPPCGEGRREAAGWGSCGSAPPPRLAILRSASIARRPSPQGAGRPSRMRRVWPLRPGRPPGQRGARDRRPPHEIHEILADIHGLALWALEPADTS